MRALDRRLRPVVPVGDEQFAGLAFSLAPLSFAEIGPWVASAQGARDDVARALDMVLSGV